MITYRNSFASSIADFTTVNTDSGNQSVGVVGGVLQLEKTAGAASAWDTLGLYKTAPTAAVEGAAWYWVTTAPASVDIMFPMAISGTISFSNVAALYFEQPGNKFSIFHGTTSGTPTYTPDTPYFIRAQLIDDAGDLLMEFSVATSFGTWTVIGESNATGGPYNGDDVYWSVNQYTNNKTVTCDDFKITDDGEFTPPAPEDLDGAAVGSSAIDLVWSDGTITAVNADSLSLERSLTSGSGFSEIATPAIGDEAYSDTGLSPETTYYYRIRAKVSAYGDDYYSDYSDEFSVETAAAADPGEEAALLLDILE